MPVGRENSIITESWDRVAARMLTSPWPALLRSSICPEGIGWLHLGLAAIMDVDRHRGHNDASRRAGSAGVVCLWPSPAWRRGVSEAEG